MATAKVQLPNGSKEDIAPVSRHDGLPLMPLARNYTFAVDPVAPTARLTRVTAH